MVVGLQVGQGLIYGDVETGGYKGVLETRTLRGVVMDVVGGHHRNACIPGYSRQPPVAVRVSLQEVLLQLYVHGARTEPVQGIASAAPQASPIRSSMARRARGPSRPPVRRTTPSE